MQNESQVNDDNAEGESMFGNPVNFMATLYLIAKHDRVLEKHLQQLKETASIQGGPKM